MNNQEPQSRVKKYNFNQGQSTPSRTNNRDFRVWPWILLLIVIIVVLIGGIKWFTKNDQSTNSNKNAESHISRKANFSSGYHSSNKHETKKSTNSSSTTSSKSNKDKDTNTSKSSPKNQNDSFSGNRQFSSVQDAQSWAQATQSSWLKAGYNNYTITSDGQGYYTLRFTK